MIIKLSPERLAHVIAVADWGWSHSPFHKEWVMKGQSEVNEVIKAVLPHSSDKSMDHMDVEEDSRAAIFNELSACILEGVSPEYTAKKIEAMAEGNRDTEAVLLRKVGRVTRQREFREAVDRCVKKFSGDVHMKNFAHVSRAVNIIGAHGVNLMNLPNGRVDMAEVSTLITLCASPVGILPPSGASGPRLQ